MEYDPDELLKWLDSHTLTRQKKNLHRDFSDAVPLAEILKQHFPRLVDLHNYSPKNSFAQKIINWEVINKKVLSKLQLRLSNIEMEQLARGVPGSIEKLLQSIKTKIESKSASGDQIDSTRVYYVDDDTNFSSKDGIIPVKIRNGNKTVERKMVAAEMFDKMEKDLLDKDKIIQELKDKVVHLENLLNIKEGRIKDLTQQLQTIVNDSAGHADLNSPKSRFFQSIF